MITRGGIGVHEHPVGAIRLIGAAADEGLGVDGGDVFADVHGGFSCRSGLE